MLFAAQAATAIANACTHRAPERARADLETLVETSPVGLAVFECTHRPPGVVQPRGAPASRRIETYSWR